MIRHLSNSTLAEFKIEWNRKESKAGREEIGDWGVGWDGVRVWRLREQVKVVTKRTRRRGEMGERL